MSYSFNNLGRIGSDSTDNSQRNVYNTKFANYTLSNFFNDKSSNAYVDFALTQPTLSFSGLAHGNGLPSQGVDTDSFLLIKTTEERPLDKLQLQTRPFATIPFLGRGSCDPDLESQMRIGELTSDRKSVTGVTEKQYIDYNQYPLDKHLADRISNPAYSIEEYALSGWVRGGISTRDTPLSASK